MLLNERDSIQGGHISIEPLRLAGLEEKKIAVDVMRLDKIHPVISGNKWFKLKYYLQEAAEKRYRSLLSFGGPYSNHIIAVACAAQAMGLESTGIIRGEKPASLSPTLLAAAQYGMRLLFISRDAYQKKDSPAYLEALVQQFPGALIIPEGGSGFNGVKGSREILSVNDTGKYTHIVCASGTGTMYCGLANGLLPQQRLTCICVLKGMNDAPVPAFQWLEDYVNRKQLTWIHDYHFGGYAKKTPALLTFMNTLYSQTGLPTDFVYTGKLFYGLCDLLKIGYFSADEKLLIIHSGGLQGNASLNPGSLIF